MKKQNKLTNPYSLIPNPSVFKVFLYSLSLP